jgi:indole-3-glycerol phosphate synthase
MTVLERIIQDTRARITQRKEDIPESELRERALAAIAAVAIPATAAVPTTTANATTDTTATVVDERRGFREALSGPQIAVIAEFKRRSPSAGALRESADVIEMARAYERAGARAMSVLTEEAHFGGSLEDLRAARAACGLPVLRKDFIVDAYQLYEARAAGADAVLLIVAALGATELERLHGLARELELDVLVEVHDAQELSRALAVGGEVIGINNRDLRDFSVDVERTFALLEGMPAGVTVVSESGISGPEQLERLHRAGVAAVLVGETLMRAADPEQALRALKSYPGARTESGSGTGAGVDAEVDAGLQPPRSGSVTGRRL